MRGGGPDQVSRQIDAYVCHIEVSFFVDFTVFWPMFVLLNACLSQKFVLKNVLIFHNFCVLKKNRTSRDSAQSSKLELAVQSPALETN